MQTKDLIHRYLRTWVLPDLAIILFCIVLLAIVWGATFWQIERDRQSTITAVMNDGDKFSRAFEEHVRRVLKTNEQYLSLLKAEYEASQSVTPSLQRFLSLLAQDPLVIQLALVDAQGKPVTSFISYPASMGFTDMPFFREHVGAVDNRLFIGAPFMGRVSGLSSIPLSYRLNNPDGSFAGIVYLSIKPDYFTKFYRDMNFNEDYVVRVIGLDGVIRASNATADIGIDVSERTVFKELAKSPTGFFRSPGMYSGMPRWMNYRAMTDYPLVVQVGVSEAVLLSWHQRWISYLGAAGTVSLFIIYYTSILMARSRRQRQAENQLQRNLRTLEEKDQTLWALFNNMHDAFALHEMIYDDRGKPLDYRFLAVNPAFERLVGFSDSQLVGHTVLEVMPNTETYWIDAYAEVALTGQPQSFINYSRELDRHYSVRGYRPQQGQFATLILDITEQKCHEELVKHHAYHDGLTGLPNRSHYYDKMKTALEYAACNKEKLAVMFLDLDDFKRINDSVGHAAGDEFLKTVASRLKGCLFEKDTIARMGGDEFTVIIPGVDNFGAISVIAEQIINTIKETWCYDGNDFHIGTSIGIAIYPEDGEDADTLLKCADMAMYMAKNIGNSSFHFYTVDMQATTLERVSLENALHQALERNEFVLHYQPQVDQTGQLIGVEALLRWQHPERGLLYPGEFLDLAEKTGLMIPIGEWVLRTACTQSVAWQEAGYPPIITAVNISATQFQHRNFLQAVSSTLAYTRLSPALLELEITETIAMTNVKLTKLITNSLQSMGIRQALDDFGTGYSSLKYLTTFNIDTLKIDKSFIQDITCGSNNEAIVKAIIALSKNLQFEVIAEGVETKRQCDYLKQLQCQKMQGYYFSRPVPAQVIEEFFKNGHDFASEKEYEDDRKGSISY